MVPEVDFHPRIYVATSFPFQWQLQHGLNMKLTNVDRLIDPTIFQYKSRWWLLGAYRTGEDMFLHLYFSKSPIANNWRHTAGNQISRSKNGDGMKLLDGKFFPHPKARNPRTTGVRPGGRVFVYQNELYRIVQDSAEIYGFSINLYKLIKAVSIDKPITQQLIPEFQANLRSPENIGSWNKQRFHHADLQPVSSTKYDPDNRINLIHETFYVAVVDGDEFLGT